METTQVSTLRKKLDSLSSANQIRENNESANQSKASVHVSTMTQQSHRALESIFRTERQSFFFFQILPNFSLNSSDINYKTKAEGFLCCKNLNGR